MAVTGGDVCALNLQSQLIGEIEGFGMRSVTGHGPRGRDAAGEEEHGSRLPEGGSGEHFPALAPGQVGQGLLPTGAGLTGQAPGCPFGGPVTVGGALSSARLVPPWGLPSTGTPGYGCGAQCREAPAGVLAQGRVPRAALE